MESVQKAKHRTSNSSKPNFLKKLFIPEQLIKNLRSTGAGDLIDKTEFTIITK